MSLSHGTLNYEQAEALSPSTSGMPRLIKERVPGFLLRILQWLAGPARSELESPKPWLHLTTTISGGRTRTIALEPLVMRWTRPWTAPWILWILIPAYILALAFLARVQWYQTPADNFADCTSAYWLPLNQCGLDGSSCGPFNLSQPVEFRCPAKCQDVPLANERAVGIEEVRFVPLVVGGGDGQGTYRGDSWICVAAIQAGVISKNKGGCGALSLIGEFTNFVSTNRNGIKSVGFPSTFPVAYRFVPGAGADHCTDIRDYALVFNVLISAFLFLVLRPTALVLFWSIICIGYWHIVFFSDPRGAPAPLSDAFETFLPTLLASYALYRSSIRFTLPYFASVPIERAVWYLGGFWPGVLSNLTFLKLPFDRLTPSDLKARPGAIPALIVLVVAIILLAVNQMRLFRLQGRLLPMLGYYVIGGLILLIGAVALPGLNLRIHHYFIGLILLPGTAVPTRLSAVLQSFLLGLFLNGLARWGWASILQTSAELLRDAPLGSALPAFISNLTFPPLDTFSSSVLPSLATSLLSHLVLSATTNATIPMLTWPSITPPLAAEQGWDGFSLIIDDVERYRGTATNFSLIGSTQSSSSSSTSNWKGLDWSVEHFFRLAYQRDGTSGDYTRAATIFPNGTYVAPLDGPS